MLALQATVTGTLAFRSSNQLRTTRISSVDWDGTGLMNRFHRAQCRGSEIETCEVDP